MKAQLPGFCFALLVLASGCAHLAGPAYERPDVPVKEAWSAGPGDTNELQALRGDWWNAFGDSELSSLIQRALDGNADLRVVAGRMDRAEALAGVAGSRRLPTLGVSAGASYGVSRTPAEGRTGVESYDLGAGLNWELDIWGKLRKGQAAADAEIQASGADWRAAYLSLAGEVSGQYFRLRQLDELLELYDRYIEGARRMLSVYETRAQEQMVSMDVVLRQKAEAGRLQRERRDLVRERTTTQNSLAALLGLPAGELVLPPKRLTPLLVPQVPAGLPSDLLERRPDILAAEYRVLAAYELAGQARLDRLPTISLTGSGGSAGDSLGNLLSQWLLDVGPKISIPLLDPQRAAQVRVREADVRIASDQYRSTVIRAFQETENALVNRASRQGQLEIARESVADLTRVQEISQAKFDEGLLSQLEALETERGLIQAEQTALDQQARLLNDTVLLYKALGGGW